jgi:hypothetical protein
MTQVTVVGALEQKSRQEIYVLAFVPLSLLLLDAFYASKKDDIKHLPKCL